ncbi:restriction endonuclease subunit S [Amycolatopsis sp. NPDC051045]|uniref:restriction endonuclease subunit S n=1 Tax=Amycolatopsis sp. NPDC051045 TaxID=3156922 RepID=UPI00344A1711
MLRPLDRQAQPGLGVVTAYRDGIVTLRSNRREDGYTFSDTENGYQEIRPGDLVFHALDGFAGAVGVSDSHGNASPVYHVCESVADDDLTYLARLLRHLGTSGFLATQAPNVRERSVDFRNWSTFARIPLALPPADEQRAIAGYLDRETARIDTLIEEQQRLIEMLRGRRKALVEMAVFSGLEGAPMKNNAEPWLPQTPSHWRVMQLGFMSDTVAGYAFPSDGFSADEAHVRLLRGVNVKPGKINWTDTVYWDVEAAAIPSEFVLEVGDLVFGMDRPFVGGGVRVAAISDDDLPALLLQRVMRIRANDEAGRGYMHYVMSTDAFFNYLQPLFTGVSVPHVSEWQVRKFKMPFPPLGEQKSIAAYLDKQTAKIDALIEETERFVELARERRSALITAAVTGQIDVREMV